MSALIEELKRTAKRDRALRRHRARDVLELLCGFLDGETPQRVKASSIALLLECDRFTSARALRLLVLRKYLRFHERDARGVGTYTLFLVRDADLPIRPHIHSDQQCT